MGRGATPRADRTSIQDRLSGRGSRLCLLFCPRKGKPAPERRVGLRKGPISVTPTDSVRTGASPTTRPLLSPERLRLQAATDRGPCEDVVVRQP